MNFDRFDELYNRVETGRASAAERHELATLLEKSPEFRRRLVDSTLLSVQLKKVLTATGTANSVLPQSSTRGRPFNLMAAAVVFGALGVLLWYFVAVHPHPPGTVSVSPTRENSQGFQAVPPFATLIFRSGRIQCNHVDLVVGAPIPFQTLCRVRNDLPAMLTLGDQVQVELGADTSVTWQILPPPATDSVTGSAASATPQAPGDTRRSMGVLFLHAGSLTLRGNEPGSWNPRLSLETVVGTVTVFPRTAPSTATDRGSEPATQAAKDAVECNLDLDGDGDSQQLEITVLKGQVDFHPAHPTSPAHTASDHDADVARATVHLTAGQDRTFYFHPPWDPGTTPSTPSSP
ncbi:MAG: hypothetical protein ACREJ2_09715 [Planctomycetota bacterium]